MHLISQLRGVVSNSSVLEQTRMSICTIKRRHIGISPKCQLVFTALLIIGVLCFVLSFRSSLRSCLLWVEAQEPLFICLLFVCMFTVVSFPFVWGYLLLNLACGYLFGILLGLFLVVFSATTGVVIAHVIIKKCLSKCVLSRILSSSNSFKAVVGLLSTSQAFRVVAFARLTPIPFGLQNAIFATSTITLRKYLTASVVGLLPTQIVNVYMGSTLRSIDELLSDHSTITHGYIVVSLQMMLSIVLLLVVVQRARRELRQTMFSSNHYACNDNHYQCSTTNQPSSQCNAFDMIWIV